jgi:hypothetical protein
MTLLMLPAIAALHSKPQNRSKKPELRQTARCRLFEGPYTLAGAAEPVVPQVIPTYSIGPANVPDLFLAHFVPKSQHCGLSEVKKCWNLLEPFWVPQNGK